METPHLILAASKRRPRRRTRTGGEGGGLPTENNFVAEAPKKHAGARPGNRNAVTHGAHMVDSRARLAHVAALVQQLKDKAAAAIEAATGEKPRG